MNVRKFFASTTRQALREVRQGLGPDALILANRPVEGGVEILAVGESEMPSLAEPSASTPERPLEAHAREDWAHMVMRELRSMRSLIEEQLACQAWDHSEQGDPDKSRVLRQLLRAGFSAALARELLVKMPRGLPDKLAWVRGVLERNLVCVGAAEEIVERGGVYALVGPTGVGKTTTIAKIASRCVVRYGAERLALLTTDSYRIGAHEQLRIYGKLLGVKVLAIKESSDLRSALEELRSKHLVLIDTVGMSQRDPVVAEQLSLLCSAADPVKRLLLLNGAGNAETLDDVVRAYRGEGLHGCILTKIDEAVGIATALDVAIRHRLPVHYVTNGQRVPEDLHLPVREYLLHRALRPVANSPAHALEPAECRLIVAGAAQGACLA